VADDVIDTSGRSIKEIVTEAVELLTSQNRTDRT
jgi:hypothetical protein